MSRVLVDAAPGFPRQGWAPPTAPEAVMEALPWMTSKASKSPRSTLHPPCAPASARRKGNVINPHAHPFARPEAGSDAVALCSLRNGRSDKLGDSLRETA